MARPATPPLPPAPAAPALRVVPQVLPALATATAQRAFKVLQSSSAPAQRSLFLRPHGAG
jgi:hypothetical protein